MGEVLEGRGVGQLLQDAVVLEVLLRRAGRLSHNACDDQDVWCPGICNRNTSSAQHWDTAYNGNPSHESRSHAQAVGVQSLAATARDP